MKLKKRAAEILFVMACAILAVAVPAVVTPGEAAAVIKPDKVEGVELARTSKTSVNLSWTRNDSVKGYQIWMKKGKGGSYKAVKTTRKDRIKIKNLSLGQTYYFKVRAYVNSRRKKVYGRYSDVTKYKMANWVYLSDVMQPYGGSLYNLYAGKDKFEMGSKTYYYGFIMWNLAYVDSGDLFFNLGGKYSSMSFEWGGVDGEDSIDEDEEATVQIYADNTLIDTLTRRRNDLPKSHTLDVRDVYKLRLIRNGDFSAGFGNVKLYY